MSDLSKLLKFFLLLLVGLLSACTENTPTTNNSQPSSVTAQPSVSVSNIQVSPTTPLSSPTTNNQQPTTLPAPTTDNRQPTTSNQILAALKNFNDNTKSYSFTVKQSAQIKNGAATTRIEANGNGKFATASLYQKLTLNLEGQTQTLENYLNGPNVYQKLAALAIWRKLDLPASTNLPATLPNNAGNFQVQTNSGAGQTQLSYTFPVATLFAQKVTNGPELLGVLSATEIFRPFLANPDPNAQAEVKLLVNDSANQIIRREINFTLTNAGSTLTYAATYDFSAFNAANVTLTPPPGLPK